MPPLSMNEIYIKIITCTIYSQPKTFSSLHAIVGDPPVALAWGININNKPYLKPFFSSFSELKIGISVPVGPSAWRCVSSSLSPILAPRSRCANIIPRLGPGLGLIRCALSLGRSDRPCGTMAQMWF